MSTKMKFIEMCNWISTIVLTVLVIAAGVRMLACWLEWGKYLNTFINNVAQAKIYAQVKESAMLLLVGWIQFGTFEVIWKNAKVKEAERV